MYVYVYVYVYMCVCIYIYLSLSHSKFPDLSPWYLLLSADLGSPSKILRVIGNTDLTIHRSYCQFSCSVVSDSLQPHGQQHTRLPHPSPTPGACSNSCASSWWCHPSISSSVVPFFSCLQSYPASESFPMSQLFASGSQSISFSNEYSGLISFRMDWLDLLAVQGPLKSLLQHHSSKASVLQHSDFFMVQLTSIPDYWKNHSFDYTDLCWESNVSAF